MKVVRHIIIEQQDFSAMLADLEELVGLLSGSDDSWVKEEFPQVSELRRVLGEAVMAEPRERVYDRLTSLEEKFARIRKRLRIVPDSGQTPTSPS